MQTITKLYEAINDNGTVENGVYRNTKNNNYAQIDKNSDGTFTVYVGYSVDSKKNDAYGRETITDRKTYKSEKLAITKAEQHTGLKTT